MKKRKIWPWLALACLVAPMFASYYFDDMFSTLSHIFREPGLLRLGWSSADYGIYAGAYSFLCVFGGLVVGGLLLDMYGVRKMGTFFVALMVGGAALVTFALRSGLSPKASLSVAYIGKMLFGLGSEIAGVAVTRSIAKWFKSGGMALAMGLQLAIARLGTAFAFIIAPLFIAGHIEGEVYSLAETSRPAMLGMGLLLAGALLWLLFLGLDAAFDARRRKEALSQAGKLGSPSLTNGYLDRSGGPSEGGGDPEKFQFSDIGKMLANKQFIMLALLCVFFYCCIVSFKKFGTAIVIPRFGMEVESAKWVITMIPFFTVIFTPLFGALVDKAGGAPRWMLLGSLMVLAAHLIIGFAPSGQPFFGYAGIALLGTGYSLVPSAMWPTVPKIVPEKNLGTAYSLIYWVQNLGMLLVPLIVGSIFSSTLGEVPDDALAAKAAVRAEMVFTALGLLAVAVALLFLRSAKKEPRSAF